MRSKRRRRDSADSSSSAIDPFLTLFPAAGGDIDRLTELPDVLRLHILSLLPLKFAIRSGALSSRWRGLWRIRWPQPSLLDISPPLSLPHSDFVAAVDDFIRRRGCLRLDSLQILFSPSSPHIPDLKRWLDYAAACSVSDLHLDLSPPTHSSDSAGTSRRRRARATAAAAPILDFTCESPTLTRLTLRGFHLTYPSFKKLAYSLEILNLCDIYLSYASLRRILVSCPLLRSLSIRRCPDLKKVVVPSSALRLTRLTVADCRKASEISVSVLGLRSFHFCGALLKNFDIESSPTLEDVYISSGGAVPAMPRGDWVKPLVELANLKVLTLCSLSLEYIAALGSRAKGGFRWLPSLLELQLLMLVMADSNLSDIYSFFKLCPSPKLEKLFIELPMNACDPSIKSYLEVPKEDPPDGGFDHLKIVKMNGFKGHQNETLLAGFFLAKACNLEHLVVISSQLDSGDSLVADNMLRHLCMKLSLLPKVSANADVVLLDCDDLQFRPSHSQI
ncbi:F-box/FBD/LRR-repeat protein [Apostasia shenzhenica]|uniref:F-box/FBD/LRR-repeat protein n=1 Tax=Apostasia shenzhenica TaxID=1088818 RepID=A0A2I0B7C5_9ASPA|nr:F-box/FBD/LRR-repeat protein [Apostasia shenzhenica]